MQYYSAMKKNKILPYAAILMDLQIIILSEVRQTEGDKYHMILPLCVIKNIIQMKIYIQNRKRIKDIENKLIVTTRIYYTSEGTIFNTL